MIRFVEDTGLLHLENTEWQLQYQQEEADGPAKLQLPPSNRAEPDTVSVPPSPTSVKMQLEESQDGYNQKSLKESMRDSRVFIRCQLVLA